MLHAGLDLSRRKIDVCLLSERGEHLDQLVAPPDVEALRRLARRIDEVHGEPVCAVIESMTGARLVHDTLEACGWEVEIADAQKVKGLAPLALKTDKTDSLVLRRSRSATWCRRSGCLTPGFGTCASWPAFACTWSTTSRRLSVGSTRP
jgi:transposase